MNDRKVFQRHLKPDSDTNINLPGFFELAGLISGQVLIIFENTK